jgi:hypothetical protein
VIKKAVFVCFFILYTALAIPPRLLPALDSFAAENVDEEAFNI